MCYDIEARKLRKRIKKLRKALRQIIKFSELMMGDRYTGARIAEKALKADDQKRADACQGSGQTA